MNVHTNNTSHSIIPAAFGANQPLTMSSREIADLVETRHNDLIATIERQIDAGILRVSRNNRRRVEPEGRGRPIEVYDLDKRDTLIVASGYRDDLRAKIIDRWMELEERAAKRNDPMEVLNDPMAMRGLLLTYSEKVIALQTENSELKPQAEALERISESFGSVCPTVAAKSLQVAPRWLIRWLRANSWMYRRSGSSHDVAYQDKINTGLMENKPHTYQTDDGTDRTVYRALVTPKGIAKLAQIFNADRQDGLDV
ncbi:phage antirepressor KilAC domain-containing protein [Chelatococcus sp. GCM10030263]|uniref:phage antirepressor KilAC domain-containing protein n=1 Tax=Chelatococcus sp. GCM10030263 TaxID=3273387 RepID=UPI00361D6673